jgi:hypothetical protein
MPAFIVAWAGGSGWVSPGNIVHTFNDYERQHLLNHSTWVHLAIRPSHQYAWILQEYSRLTPPLAQAGV